ncbi:MAG: hypothetical protein IK016_06955 [Lachnospiraceae bacterium]|nr:hypothetical protein [Lachnospiraceae bacterium]
MEQYVYCVPESDTVFRLYDDTNSPYGADSYFLLEDGGTMAWCEGMGAIRYVREPNSGTVGIGREIFGAWRADEDGSVIVFYENNTFEWTGFYQNADGQETAAYVTGTMMQIGFDEKNRIII